MSFLQTPEDSINQRIRDAFYLCEHARIAIDTQYNELSKHKISYDTKVQPAHIGVDNVQTYIANDSIDNIYAPKHIWNEFIKQSVRQIAWYGYIVYYYKSNTPSVVCGSNVEIYIKPGKRKYGLRIVNPDFDFLKNQKLHLRIVAEPTFDYSGNYIHPNSVMYDAYHTINKQLLLQTNLFTRDNINTYPSIFTQRGSGVNRSNGLHNLEAHHADVLTSEYITSTNDLDFLYQTREEETQRSRALTESIRNSDTSSSRPTVQAREYVVSEDTEYKELRHLPQDTIIVINTFERLGHQIMSILGTPAQATGDQVNAERKQESGHVTNQAMSYFFNTVVKLIDVLNDLFESMAKDKNVVSVPSIVKITTTMTINQNRNILKTKRLAELLADNSGLLLEDFDLTKVNAEQELALGINKETAEKESDSFHSNTQSKKRRVQTPNEKEATYAAKQDK
jgi:hypothetical protein